MAQVEINKSLIFTNEIDSLSQINELGNANDSTSLLNHFNLTSEKLISLRLAGNGNYSFTPPFPGFELKIGMQFHLLIDTSNISTPMLITSIGNFPIILQNGNSILPNTIPNNSILRVVFNGAEFQVAQYYRNSCPVGFISINDNYCIEISERSSTIYTQAVATCNSLGANLCSWSEWYYACANLNGTSVFSMTNNWEFIDDASNHTDTNSVVGSPGGGGCQSFFSENIDLFNRNYRCCYKK